MLLPQSNDASDDHTIHIIIEAAVIFVLLLVIVALYRQSVNKAESRTRLDPADPAYYPERIDTTYGAPFRAATTVANPTYQPANVPQGAMAGFNPAPPSSAAGESTFRGAVANASAYVAVSPTAQPQVYSFGGGDDDGLEASL